MPEVLAASKTPEITNLLDIEDQSQFEALYRAKGLNGVEAKIGYLKKAMKIRAIRCDEDETPEEILSGLEDSVLEGFWRAYQ